MKQHLDRTLRPALDDCLSGVDALPSQREQILHRAVSEDPLPHRIPHAILIPLLLVILLGFAGAAAFTGVIDWYGEPTDVPTPTPLPYAVVEPYLSANDSMTERIASNFLRMEQEGALRVMRYQDERGQPQSLTATRSRDTQSFESLIALTDGSGLPLPAAAFWDTSDYLTASVFYDCRFPGAYELTEQSTVYPGIEMYRYRPSEGSDFVSGLYFSSFGSDNQTVFWHAFHRTSTDDQGFPVSDYQHYTILDIPGMTNAIAVSSNGKTYVYMRKVLSTPVFYTPVHWMTNPEEHFDESPWRYDEIYAEIEATGYSPDDILSWLSVP